MRAELQKAREHQDCFLSPARIVLLDENWQLDKA